MKQRYKNLEHVVMDGGSTDSSLDILRSYESAYPLRWQSRGDSGMYEAINRGLRKARGDIIAYLNADDRYLPWTIERVVEVIGSRTNEPIIALGDVVAVGDGADACGRGYLRLTPPLHFGLFRLSPSLVSQPGIFFSRPLLDALAEFDESLGYVGDFDFWARGLRAAGHVRLKEIVAVETEHEERKTTRDYSRLVDELNVVKIRFGPRRGWHVALARAYTFAARRVMFIGFLIAIARHRFGWKRGGWNRFIAYADPTFSMRSFVYALVPGRWSARAGVALRSARPEWTGHIKSG